MSQRPPEVGRGPVLLATGWLQRDLCSSQYCSASMAPRKASGENHVRNLMASVLLATWILAHEFWRAGSKLHHLFGVIFLVLVAVIVLPISLARRALRDTGNQPDTKDK